ncbi:tyrosine-protein phosphatase [Pseudoroseicyclus tamaricis]|uniref:Dual specificity protein phosphatase family protein n=1 Tax=Pseudoroseicyclus tamaricis TaxID=2705421 RepID=A0A6B2K125_9RHOB|nr:tyrosine-protein phosphatase [Pseudoroseicyclus tamaricis]NDV01402.1 dual specificity protein phosphatase family protein [Pseudoroseicyclus tamaricis]
MEKPTNTLPESAESAPETATGAPVPDVVPHAGEPFAPTFRHRWKYAMADHAILRRHWRNFKEFAPGAYRSNHPTVARLAEYKAQGIRSVLCLRGAPPSAAFRIEAAACAELGLTLWTTPLRARKAPPVEAVLRAFEIFRRIDKPFLLHCKSGADRAGFGSALYLLHLGRPVEEAQAQLSWKHWHIRRGPTAVLDAVLDLYAQDAAQIGPEEWFATRYDPVAIQAAFERGELAYR